MEENKNSNKEKDTTGLETNDKIVNPLPKSNKRLLIMTISLFFLLALFTFIYLFTANVPVEPIVDEGDDTEITTITPTPTILTPESDISYLEYLVICSEGSAKQCFIKDPDGGLKETELNIRYEFFGDIAVGYDTYTEPSSKLYVYKFNGNEYVKKQEYIMHEVRSVFITNDHVYAYQSSMVNLDDSPIYFGEDVVYENDVEGHFKKFGIEERSEEELKKVEFFNTLSPDDTIGGYLEIFAVDEPNSLLFYYDFAGGAFFYNPVRLHWESGDEDTIKTYAGHFLAMAPDFSAFYYTDEQYLIKHDFTQQIILQDLGSYNNRLDLISFLSPEKFSYYQLETYPSDSISDRVYIYEVQDDIPVLKCQLNIPKLHYLRGVVGINSINFTTHGDTEDIRMALKIDTEDCSSSEADIEGYNLQHILLVAKNQ